MPSLEERVRQRQRLAELGFRGHLTRQSGYPSPNEVESVLREALAALEESALWVGQDSPSAVYRFAKEMGLMDESTFQRARRGLGRSFNSAGS